MPDLADFQRAFFDWSAWHGSRPLRRRAHLVQAVLAPVRSRLIRARL